MTIELRAADTADIPAITAIYAHHVRTGLASFELEAPTADEMGARFEAITRAGYPYLVAAIDERIVGYAYANHYRTRPAYRYSVENSVYVDTGSAGRGIGKQLLQRLIAECEACGYRQMLAVIGDSANFASIGLHRSCGFTQVGLLPAIGFKFGRWVDSVLMQRELGAGQSDTTVP